METEKVVEYWIKSAEEDYKSAQGLFTLGRYSHCLFFCHLTIEKILKGFIVKYTKEPAPYEHNILHLVELLPIKFSDENLDRLAEINTFNISGRYDDYKFEFYKKATKEYTERFVTETNNIFIWITMLPY